MVTDMDVDSQIRELERHYQKYGCYGTIDFSPVDVYRKLPDPNVKYQGEPILHLASSYADYAGVSVLRDAGADMDALSTDGYNALHSIVYGVGGRQEKPQHAVRDTAVTLVRAGVDPLAALLNGETVLLLAAKHGLCELLTAVHRTDEDIRQIDHSGNTALHLACSYAVMATRNFNSYRAYTMDRLEVASAKIGGQEAALARARRISIKEFERRTRQLEMYNETITYLLNCGLDPLKKNYRGDTALSIVYEGEDERLLRLVRRKAPCDTAFEMSFANLEADYARCCDD